MGKLDQLPFEVLQLVVQYANKEDNSNFKQLSMVNRSLYNVVISKIWQAPKRVDELGLHLHLAIYLLSSLELAFHHPQRQFRPIPIGHHIRKLIFTRKDAAEDIPQLLTHTPLLEDLTLDELRITDMEKIVSHCPRIHRLELVLRHITDQGVAPIGQLPLRELSLKSCFKLTAKSLLALKSCPLKILNIYDIDGMTGEDAATHMSEFKQLVEFSLTMRNTGIQSDFLPQLSLSHLTKVRLDGFRDQVNDHLLVPFIYRHPQLKNISLRKCVVGFDTLRAINTCLTNFSDISLQHCEGFTLPILRGFIQTSPPSLVYLDVTGCLLVHQGFPETSRFPLYIQNFNRHELELVRRNPWFELTTEQEDNAILTVLEEQNTLTCLDMYDPMEFATEEERRREEIEAALFLRRDPDHLAQLEEDAARDCAFFRDFNVDDHDPFDDEDHDPFGDEDPFFEERQAEVRNLLAFLG